jgi:hypothetical protein
MPQQESPLDTLAKMGDIRARNQQMQTAQLQQQALQQENQQRQIELDDSRKMSQAWMQAGGDLDKTAQLFAQMGGSPKGMMALQQQVMQMKEQKAKLSTAELQNLGAKNDQIESLLQPVLAESDPAKQKPLWDSALATAVQKGLLTADEATQHPYQGPDVAKQYATGLQTEKWVTAQAAKERGAAAQQQADTAKAADQRKQADEDLIHGVATLGVAQPKSQAEYQQLVGQLPPAAAQRILQAVPVLQFDPATSMDKIRRLGMTPEQQTQADQAAANAKETARHNAAEESQGTQRIGIEQKRTNLQEQQLGFDTNGGVSQTARMIAGGQIDPQTTRSMLRRSPGLIEQVKRADPNFDEANIDNRYETLKEFTNTSVGKAGGQALALNTLIHHADLFQRVGEALKNNSFRPGNALYNEVSTMFGGPAPTDAKLVARFLAGETGKVATGGVPAEGEINGILQSLSTNNSPDQLVNAGKTILQIAAGRATPLMEKVHQAKLDNQVQVIGDDARGILKRRGFDPNTMKPAGQGAPPLPATGLSQSDVGKVYMSPKTGKAMKITAVNPANPKQFKSEEVQ